MNLPKPFQMNVDRPFLFLVEEEETRTILFMGLVLDPGAASGSQANCALTGRFPACLGNSPDKAPEGKTYTVEHSTNIPETPLHTGTGFPGLVPLQFQKCSFSALRAASAMWSHPAVPHIRAFARRLDRPQYCLSAYHHIEQSRVFHHLLPRKLLVCSSLCVRILGWTPYPYATA